MDRRRRQHRINISLEASGSTITFRRRRTQRNRIVSDDNTEEADEDLPPTNNVSDTESMESSSDSSKLQTLLVYGYVFPT